MGGHFIRTNLGDVPAQDSVIQPVEDEQQPHVHPRTRLRVEYQVEAEERRHHYDVADDAQNVAQLVQ